MAAEKEREGYHGPGHEPAADGLQGRQAPLQAVSAGTSWGRLRGHAVVHQPREAGAQGQTPPAVQASRLVPVPGSLNITTGYF